MTRTVLFVCLLVDVPPPGPDDPRVVAPHVDRAMLRRANRLYEELRRSGWFDTFVSTRQAQLFADAQYLDKFDGCEE